MNNYEHSDLTPSQRRNLILDMMKKKKSVSVHQLSKELYLHEATVRRDLNYLADSGAISRVHGGAVLREGMDAEIPLFIRETSFKEIKKELARTAAETVKDGESIFLDSSSTTSFMIPFLTDRKQLKIVTNGAQAVLYLTRLHDARIFCTGGRLRENSLSYIGHSALEAVSHYHFDRAFFSCRGVCLENGLSDTSEEEAVLRQAVIRRSEQSVLLADHSKLGQMSFYSICPLSDIQMLITDAQLSPEWQLEGLTIAGETELSQRN
ncbi:DeoR/GlpR family DNA-binding transcription regulator [Lachnospiraceae bacterium ASD3451]|uniref:DeoR/GlpR family DNA-binding transcription regulator n=1 Tax=Diplocloster agilis TaxID=2850323 RepID=UPI001DA40DE8|nr:DeoR/GlpR family DNA-binding transcription regulator [Diplocloster agilis]MBU9745794.1 DeoR/GlpR family DNA-binding transcription regulator [Diplocloster agilis]